GVAGPFVAPIKHDGDSAPIESLAGRAGNSAMQNAEPRDAGTHVHALGLPLAYIYARNVLVLSTASPDKPAFAAFLEQMRARYRRVLFLGGGGTDLLSSRWSVAPIASERFRLPGYEPAWNAYHAAP